MLRTNLVIRRFVVVGLPEIMCCAENFFGLLDGVFGLAGNEQGCQGNVLVVVLVAREPHAELMVVDGGRVKRLHWPAIALMSAIVPGDG